MRRVAAVFGSVMLMFSSAAWFTPPAIAQTVRMISVKKTTSIMKATARGPTPTGARANISRVYRRALGGSGRAVPAVSSSARSVQKGEPAGGIRGGRTRCWRSSAQVT